MSSEDDIVHQKNLLSQYRSNVRILLAQAAQYNGESSAPLVLINNLQGARDHIAQSKTFLRNQGIDINDHPDDIPLVRRELDLAVDKQHTAVSDNDRSQVLRRARYAASALQGAQLLWLDDNPNGNIYERRIFRSLGIFVDLAQSTTEAIAMLRLTKYDVIISDMGRGINRKAGVQFLADMSQHNLYRWTIIYTTPAIVERGLPRFAFAITARPDHLLHYVIDAIERERL